MFQMINRLLLILKIQKFWELINIKGKQEATIQEFSIFKIVSTIKNWMINIIGAIKVKLINTIQSLNPINILKYLCTQIVKPILATIISIQYLMIMIPIQVVRRIFVKFIEVLHIYEFIRSIYIASREIISQSLTLYLAIFQIIVDKIVGFMLLPQQIIISLLHKGYQCVAIGFVFLFLLLLFLLQILYDLTKKRQIEQEIEMGQQVQLVQHIDQQNQESDQQQLQVQDKRDHDSNGQQNSQEPLNPQEPKEPQEPQEPQKPKEPQESQQQQQPQPPQYQNENANSEPEIKQDNQGDDNIAQQQNDQQDHNHKNDQEVQQQEINQEQSQQLIQRIIDLYNKNLDDEFKPFIGEEHDQNKLLEHYIIKNDDEKGLKFVDENLNGFIRVRGDGNCFYTSLIYQYLNYMLQNQQRFDILKNQLDSITLYCVLEDQDIDVIQQDEALMKQILLSYFQQIFENPDKLKELLQNYNNEFYGLSIIYFKSLLLYLYLKNEELQAFAAGADIENDLKVWLKMSNSAEILMKLIADQLNWSIQIYFLQSQESVYQVQKYQNDKNEHEGNFLLLFQPGHYQIPIIKH